MLASYSGFWLLECRGELIFSPSENTSNSLRVLPRALAQARRCVLSDGGRVKPIGNGSAE
ncbi:hypothetical protein DEO72_LG2g3263 [Vigna unguiculata]|uniref:Uncharacterized protein n=1 Tax=Vigna unguiculata TaxID=3917 RepID=A0A4D6L372_VIGUN|nr:hypothetical protein DEO72_LG2g3262 [Vigna unguiculata]QCD82921.1 hypothetical protein DEO72_LG2g3263 [Vigna unguiculata]